MPATLDPPRNGIHHSPRIPRIPDWCDLTTANGATGAPPVSASSSLTGAPPVSASSGLTSASPVSTPKPAFPMVLIEAVMADFIMTALPLPALAKRHDLSLSAAADLLESPEFQSLLARFTRLAEQRARTAAVMHRATALIILERDISTCVGDPEFTRKACAVLLRASELELYPDQFRRARRTPRRNPLDAIAQSTLSGSAEPDPDTPPDASPVPNDAPPAPGALDTQGRNQLGDSDAPESLAMKLSAAAGTVHSLPLRKKHGSPDPTRARAKRARD